MKLNRKGFTLIELLVTIVIIGLVIALSTYGIISAVNSSKEKAKTLSESSIKEAARTYSTEASSDSWKILYDSNYDYDYDAFCVTVGELMNKGLLDKNAEIKDSNIDRNTFVMVKRNKITLAVLEEEIGDESTRICTGTITVPEEDTTAPKIGGSSSYTDKIIVNFELGSATYNGEESTTSYKCLYGESSSNINREGKIEGNSCVLEGLKHNRNYYVIIYMNTNHGSSIAATGEKNYMTKDFVKPTITQDKNVVTVEYDDTNVLVPSHYFYSTVAGTSDVNVEKCTLNNNVMDCNGTTKNIEKDVWYRVSGTNVVITYPEENNDVKVSARIYDGSNNYVESSDDFGIRKYTIKFYKGSASKIDGETKDYVEKYCITEKNKTCEITSPSITAPSGYSALGWNTSSSATSSSWNASTQKAISASDEYYAILKINTYDITITSGTGGSVKIDDTTKGTSATAQSGGIATLSVNHGDIIKVTATANTDYNLSTLKHGNTSISSGSTFTVSGTETVVATWIENTYTVTVKHWLDYSNGTFGDTPFYTEEKKVSKDSNFYPSNTTINLTSGYSSLNTYGYYKNSCTSNTYCGNKSIGESITIDQDTIVHVYYAQFFNLTVGHYLDFGNSSFSDSFYTEYERVRKNTIVIPSYTTPPSDYSDYIPVNEYGYYKKSCTSNTYCGNMNFGNSVVVDEDTWFHVYYRKPSSGGSSSGGSSSGGSCSLRVSCESDVQMWFGCSYSYSSGSTHNLSCTYNWGTNSFSGTSNLTLCNKYYNDAYEVCS